MNKKIVKKAGKYFTQEDQHAIIQEMFSTDSFVCVLRVKF